MHNLILSRFYVEPKIEPASNFMSQATDTLYSNQPHTDADKTEHPRGVRHANVKTLNLHEFICVAPETPVKEALERMKQAEADFIFACDAGGKVLGSFSPANLVQQANFNLTNQIADVMNADFHTLEATATIENVVNKLNETKARAIAIIEDEKFIGAISDLDVITFLAESYPKATMNLPPVTHQMMDTQEGE